MASILQVKGEGMLTRAAITQFWNRPAAPAWATFKNLTVIAHGHCTVCLHGTLRGEVFEGRALRIYGEVAGAVGTPGRLGVESRGVWASQLTAGSRGAKSDVRESARRAYLSYD